MRRVAALAKAGPDLFAGLSQKQKETVRSVAAERKRVVEKATAKRVYEAWDSKQIKPDPKAAIPPLGKRLAAMHAQLFGWLDDPANNGFDPDDAVQLSVKDDSLGPCDVAPLQNLRSALKLHEDLGQDVAAAATLLKMGRRLRKAPLRARARRADIDEARRRRGRG